MTTVRFRTEGNRVTGFDSAGHSGYAEEGEDIVCAAVSALSQTAVNALEAVAGVEPEVIVRSGFLSARLPKGLRAKQRYAAEIILRSVRQGLEDIAKAYPDLVKVS